MRRHPGSHASRAGGDGYKGAIGTVGKVAHSDVHRRRVILRVRGTGNWRSYCCGDVMGCLIRAIVWSVAFFLLGSAALLMACSISFFMSGDSTVGSRFGAACIVFIFVGFFLLRDPVAKEDD